MLSSPRNPDTFCGFSWFSMRREGSGWEANAAEKPTTGHILTCRLSACSLKRQQLNTERNAAGSFGKNSARQQTCVS